MKVLKNYKNNKNREEEGGKTPVRGVQIRKIIFPTIGKRGQESIGPKGLT